MNNQDYIRLINNQKEHLIKVYMKEKINLVELLKDCPAGMELDCTMFEGLEFDSIVDNSPLPIRCRILNPDGYGYNIYNFTKYGCWNTLESAKCVIIPKGKTTWEGFVPPCKFKDGDIITDGYFKTICIFKGEGRCEGTVDYYCGVSDSGRFFVKDIKNQDEHFGYIVDYRLANEEEKEKLFQAIQDNGYKWNEETKTLEKLVEPKFKVGDKVKRKNINYVPIVTIAKFDGDCYDYFNEDGQYGVIYISKQDDWELVPNKFDINTLKPFESRVLVRDVGHNEWEGAVFGRYDGNSFFTIGGIDWKYCIPYEGNEHLLGKTDDCDEYYKNWE